MQVLLLLFHILIFPGLCFDIVMGVLLLGLCNRLVARMQNRVGPPVMQPWYDFMKCCGKETIVPRHASKVMYYTAPVLGFVLLISASLFIPVMGTAAVSSQADLVVILYLLTFVSVCMILGAASTGSPFAGVGLSREMVAMISYELPFVLVILTVARAAGAGGSGLSGATFSLQEIVKYQQINGSFLTNPLLWPAAAAMLFVIPCEAGMHPFDIAEAETEICEGTLAEYSGPPVAMYKLTHTVKVYVMTALFTAMFAGGIQTGSMFLNVVIYLVIYCLVMFFTMALPHAVCARFRVEQVFHFYWTWVAGIALLGLILVWGAI